MKITNIVETIMDSPSPKPLMSSFNMKTSDKATRMAEIISTMKVVCFIV